MTFAAFFDVFWPLIAAEVFGIVGAPIGIAVALSRFDRRRDVKRMHRMRRIQIEA